MSSYKAIIYKIVNVDDENEFFIGSSRNNINQRLACTKYHATLTTANGYKFNGKLYRRMREIGVNNWAISALGEREVANREEQMKFDREFYDQLKPTLNEKLPAITEPERKIRNTRHRHARNARLTDGEKAERAMKARDYYTNHKEAKKDYGRAYYRENAVQIKERARLKDEQKILAGLI